jgi:hypothetical protein
VETPKPKEEKKGKVAQKDAKKGKSKEEKKVEVKEEKVDTDTEVVGEAEIKPVVPLEPLAEVVTVEEKQE